MRRRGRETRAGKAGIAELLFIDLLLAGAALGLFLLERSTRASAARPAVEVDAAAQGGER